MINGREVIDAKGIVSVVRDEETGQFYAVVISPVNHNHYVYVYPDGETRQCCVTTTATGWYETAEQAEQAITRLFRRLGSTLA